MIFLTGANGLVGSFIVRKLLAQNVKLRCLKRTHSDLTLLQDVVHQIDWVEGDLLDISGLEVHLQGVHTIIHAAAIVSFDPDRFDSMFKTNVEGTANLVNVALSANIKKFLFVSSVASLGKSKKIATINENANWEDRQEVSFYAKTKYLSELEVWRGTEEGLNAVIINPSIVLGPGNWNMGSTRLFKYAYQENIFFPPGNLNYVDARDVADVAFELLNRDVRNERFILNAGNISYEFFLKAVADKFQKRAPYIKANSFISGVAWRLAKIMAFVQRKEPFLTKETAAASKNNYIYENEKLKKLLNYQYRELNETISWVTEKINKTTNQKLI